MVFYDMPKSVKQIINTTKTVIGTKLQKQNNPTVQSISTNEEVDESVFVNQDSKEQLEVLEKKTFGARFTGFIKREKPIINKQNQESILNDSETSKSLIVTSKQNQTHDLSVDVKKEKLKIKTTWFQKFNKPVNYIAILITLTSAIMFVYSGLSEKAVQLGAPDLKLEKVLIGAFVALLVLDVAFVYFLGKTFIQRVHIFFALATLQISAFLYSLKIYGTELYKVGNFTITTQIALAILPVIILLQAIDLIQNKNRMWVNIAQVFVILNQLFSTVKVFNENSFTKKQFSSPVLNFIFDFPPFVWVGFATIALAILSTYNLKQGYTRFIFVIGMMFPILNMLLYTRVTTPWYQTILGLIVWDMIYTPMFEAEKDTTDEKVISKLMVSSVYHIALFVVFLIFNTVLNFLIVKP
jgi:hypothetical protein